MRTLALLAAWIAGTATAAAQETDSTPIVRKIETLKVHLDFRGADLEEVVAYLRDVTGLNFHIDPEVRTRLTRLAPEQLKVSMTVKDLALKSVLKLLLHSRGLGAALRQGVIVIAPRDRIAGNVVTRVYDVKDLLFRIRDFAAPRMELAGPNQGGLAGVVIMPEEEKENVLTEDFITDIVKSNTGEGRWDDNPAAGVTLANGLLIVTQSGQVHGEVQRLLQMLRQFK